MAVRPTTDSNSRGLHVRISRECERIPERDESPACKLRVGARHAEAIPNSLTETLLPSASVLPRSRINRRTPAAASSSSSSSSNALASLRNFSTHFTQPALSLIASSRNVVPVSVLILFVMLCPPHSGLGRGRDIHPVP